MVTMKKESTSPNAEYAMLADVVIDSMKQAVREMVDCVLPVSFVAERVADVLGPDVARLIMADIAFDQGQDDVANGLLNNVTK